MKHLICITLTLTYVMISAASSYAVNGIRIGGCSDTCGVTGCGAIGSCGNQFQTGVQTIGCADGSHSAIVGCQQALADQNSELRQLIECMPITAYKVVLEPQYVTESRAECATEYQEETRYRTRTISRTEPVQVQDYRSKTVMVPKTETKTIEYSVLVPETSQKTVDLVETVPVWKEVPETYTVKVPHVEDVPEEYEIKVPTLRDEQFTYTVLVPRAESQMRTHTVTNAVPVTKTRTVQVCIPTTKTQTVTRDYGHWETHIDEVAVSGVGMASGQAVVGNGSGCGFSMGGCGAYVGQVGCGNQVGCGGCGNQVGCGGCGTVGGYVSNAGCGGCGTSSCAGGVAMGSGGDCNSGAIYAAPVSQTVSRRVWVPNIVTEEVPVVENVAHTQEVAYTVYEQRSEQVPYECTYLVYRPEERTGSRKVVDYVSEKRTRSRKVVKYVDESRTRTRRELSYKQVTRTETIPVVSYKTEKRTKEVSFTVNVPEVQIEPITTTTYQTIQEEVSEPYTVRVPVATTKEVQVQVCRMVPKLVSYTFSPCSLESNAVGQASGAGGCSACGGANACGGCGVVSSNGCSSCGAIQQ